MSIEWQIALFTFAFTAILALVGAGLTFWFAFGNRLTRLETTVEFVVDSLGRKAARALHSPDDHLGLDDYLDRYISKSHDMSLAEWVKMKQLLEVARDNPCATKNEQIMAEFLMELCDHKSLSTHTRKVFIKEHPNAK